MAKAKSNPSSSRKRLQQRNDSGEAGAVEVRRTGKGLSARIRRPRTAQRVLGTLGYALHKIPGGRQTFIEYARLAASENEQVACFISCWDELSKREQEAIPIDQICLESGAITPGELLGEVVKSAFQYGQDVSSLMAATCLPDVVDASIRNAKTPKGIKDRIALMQHANFVPIPTKSAIPPIINKVYAVAGARAESNSGNNGGMPSFEDDTLELSKIVRATETEGDRDDGREKSGTK